MKPIPTIVGYRPTRRHLPVFCESALFLVDVAKPTTRTTQFNVGFLNAQSLGNKTASINDCIVANNLDVFAVVESWHDSFETPSVIAATPADYRVFERARPRSGKAETTMKHNFGGICVFIRRNLKVKLVDFPLYRTFELLSLYILSPTVTSLLLVVYRPGSESPTDDFIKEFNDVLERCSSYAQCIVTGDINVHLDDPRASRTESFLYLLDNFGLSEWVRKPSHKLGHQLDVFITRSDQPVSAVKVYPPMLLSDHSLITATFTSPDQPTVPHRRRVQRRCWKRFDVTAFNTDLLESDLVVSPPTNVTELFDCYNTTLKQLVDRHVPVVTVTSYSRPTAPWYDRDCNLMKAKTRRLEKIFRRRQDSASEWEWREQFQLQRQLFAAKYTSYWTNKIDSCGTDSKMLWSRLRCLLQPAGGPVIDHSADDFAQHFANKVERIRASTANACRPLITGRSVSEPLMQFKPVTSEEVVAVLKRAPAKQCSLDPVPTWLVKQLSDVFAPIIAGLCNASFDQCILPADQKRAITRPLLKKPSLDASDLNNYRPISNLSFLSKTIERLVDARFVSYADENSLSPVYQSAYRTQHSTETALVHLYNDMVATLDQGEVGVLVLLDMSAAFDTIDHGIMLDVLQRRFDVRDAALDWFASYFLDRTQVVVTGTDSSSVSELLIGTPQGSVLGPRSFVSYTEDVTAVFQKHRVRHHLFADDMQCTGRCKPSGVREMTAGLGVCVTAVSDWCASKRLQLNTKKTEVMWFGSATNLRKLSSADKQIQVGPDSISPSLVVRDLGVFFDSELNMKTHVSRVARACFYHLRRLRSVRRQLGQEITARLVSAFVLSRLDYCNAVLAELPASTLAPLQRVIHAAARLVFDLKPRDHVTAALKALHWLPIKQRIQFKLCLLVHLAINGRAPTYIRDLITTTASMSGRASNRSASNNDIVKQSTRLKLGERAFSVAGPRAWNQLPTELKTTTNTATFKRKLKTFLFSIAYL